MGPLHESSRVRGAVEEIGVAERDVLRAGCHLRPDIRHHHIEWNRAKGAADHTGTIGQSRHRCLHPARRVGAAGHAEGTVRHL